MGLHTRDQRILDEMKSRYILNVTDEQTGALMIAIPLDKDDVDFLQLLIDKGVFRKK